MIFIPIALSVTAESVDEKTTTTETPLECSWPCPFEVKPICAANGSIYHRFNSECLLNAYNCEEGEAFYQVDLSFCKNYSQNFIEECNQRCSQKVNLICGFDGHIHNLFRNNCEKTEQECLDRFKWRNVDLEKCRTNETCDSVCPEYSHPVCASDGKEYRLFNNDCLMEAENCRLPVNKWQKISICKCDETEGIRRSRCNLVCSIIYDPVCATDGEKKKTFNSVCELTQYNCMNCAYFAIVSKTTCREYFQW